MKNSLILMVLTGAATCVSSFGATKIGATLKILSPTTSRELTTLKVGQSFKVAVTESNLNLIANKNVALTYVLSVVPKGITTPIVLSGKVAAKLTLPVADGGAAKTTQELADLAGTQSAESLLTVPDFMPEGTASLTITYTTTGLNTITLKKSIKITL